MKDRFEQGSNHCDSVLCLKFYLSISSLLM